MRISDWSSDVCTSDLRNKARPRHHRFVLVGINSAPSRTGPFLPFFVRLPPRAGPRRRFRFVSGPPFTRVTTGGSSSEDRSVGTEFSTCRSGWLQYHHKNKQKYVSSDNNRSNKH